MLLSEVLPMVTNGIKTKQELDSGRKKGLNDTNRKDVLSLLSIVDSMYLVHQSFLVPITDANQASDANEGLGGV